MPEPVGRLLLLCRAQQAKLTQLLKSPNEGYIWEDRRLAICFNKVNFISECSSIGKIPVPFRQTRRPGPSTASWPCS